MPEKQILEEEAYLFTWPPAMPVSVCLQAISGEASDILRIFDFLETSGIINVGCAAEQEMGGEWTERDLTKLRQAFAQHGNDWRAVSAQLGRDEAPEECAVVLSAISISGTPLQRLATLHAQRIHRNRGSDAETGQSFNPKSCAILGQASILHRGIGVTAAAAAVDVCMQHALEYKDEEKKNRNAEDTNTHGHDSAATAAHERSLQLSSRELESLPRMACKTSILAKLALRSCLLARRETLDMRRLMSEAVELQLERIQSKTAEVLGNKLVVSALSLAK
eukprot:Tamp_09999.p2 GENE.Tamp_09999~~Tamp_09999.p2  ORF type:complete len:279 (+),score=57.70 Tamp_09999:229-1065(+)